MFKKPLFYLEEDEENLQEPSQINPQDVIEDLERRGYIWMDDEENPEEEIEERKAVPLNLNQQKLTDYFEERIELNPDLLRAFREEKESENPNYPLLRRYFKQANPNLKSLILFGLEQDPTDDSLLIDLSFFDEFCPNLTELTKAYLTACEKEEDLEHFEKLARDFYFNTAHSGYDAFSELYDQSVPEKKMIIEKLMKEDEKESKTIIYF